MSASIAFATEVGTNVVQHINDVVKANGLSYRCVGCGKDMIVVKSFARKKDWHFRHAIDSDCSGARDYALHRFAVQILMRNSVVNVSKSLRLEYTKPRTEVPFSNVRSDVTVLCGSVDVHFEIFVTHDLDDEKIKVYKSQKVKCIRIDLSKHKWLSASSGEIEDAVLNQLNNKTIIYWEDQQVVKESKGMSGLVVLVIGGIALGAIFVYRVLTRRRKR